MSRFRFILQVFILFIYYQNCKGMTEVFGWNQMDYYNRGDGNHPNNFVNQKPTRYQSNVRDSSIIFPDQYYSIRRKFKRQQMKVTSRDAIPKMDLRFGTPNYQQSNSGNDSYIAYNNVPMGATHYKGRLFITMPRRRIGIPSTLNYIDMKKDGANHSPKLRAFPDFETNQFDLNGMNTNKLVSVYRTSVDECGRLWFIDTGMLEYPDNRIQLKRPTIWIIDLKNDWVVKQFEIPVDIAETGQGLASITIDNISSKCQQAFAYIPDLLYNRLYVYSLEQDRIWSFSHNYFNFDPVAGDLNIGGQSFRWDDGIFSITLGPRKANNERDVYFHPMASNNEFIVSNQVLQNESNAARSDHGNDFRLLGSRGMNAQSTMHEYDPITGSIFYAQIQRNGVGCWNTNLPFSAENHDNVFNDQDKMIYPSDLTIDDEGSIWVMSNTMPVFIYSNLDTNVINFRVWKTNVFVAVRNTKCSLLIY